MLSFLRYVRIFRTSFIIAISLVILWGITSEAEEKMDEGKGLTVTVLLFSGRPDPTYILDNEDAVERLKTLIAASKVNEKFIKTTVVPSILGYKGIVVDNQTKVTGVPSHLAVYKGNIEVKNEKIKFLIDEGGTIENMLLNEAIRKGVLDEKILKRMKSGPAE